MRSENTKFSKKLVDAFLSGFPDNWKVLCDEEFTKSEVGKKRLALENSERHAALPHL